MKKSLEARRPLSQRAQAQASGHIAEGMRLVSERRFSEGAELLGRAALLLPNDPQVHLNHGVALLHVSDLRSASLALKRAFSLAPGHPAILKNLGMLHLAEGAPEKAAPFLRGAIAAEPASADVGPLFNNLGVALRGAGRLREAEQAFRAALTIDAVTPDPVGNLAMILTDTCRTDEALALLRQALAALPASALLLRQLGQTLMARGEAVDGVEAMRKAFQLQRNDATLIHSWLLAEQYHPDVTLEHLSKIHSEAERLIGLPRCDRQLPVQAPSGHGPLRVGYVSGDFHRHPVGFFMAAVVPNHDPARVKAFCYQNHIQEDDVTRQIRSGGAQWRNIAKLDDDAAARQIQADGIDLLIDLSGHTGYNRLPLFALRPAPVQATWAGYVGTTGLSAMDWLIANHDHVPVEDEKYYVERIARLPNSYVAYAPPPYAPDVGVLPASRNGYVTFGCFSNVRKLTNGVIDAWCRILDQVPRSRLVLRTNGFGDSGVCRRYEEMFAGRGIAGGRISFNGEAQHADLLASYGEIDIALDTFPYSGGLTTLEALWMGVPVITVPGTTFAGHHSASHLKMAGHPELVANDVSGYVELSLKLAADLPRMQSFRDRLRQDMMKSTYLDHRSFVAELEKCYLVMLGRQTA